MSATKNVLIVLSVSVFFIGFFSGCSSKNINIIGEKRVEIIKHKAIQEGTFLKIMAELENTDNDKTEGFVYQIEWISKNGLIKDTTPWRAVTIHKNQKVQIVEMTNIPDIVDYNIIVSVPNK